MPPRTHPASSDIVTEFLNTLRARKKSDETLRHYTGVLRRLTTFLDPIHILATSPADLQRWQLSISRKSPGSVAGDISCVRVFYRWCYRPMRFIEYSPADELVAPAVPRGKPRPAPETDVTRALVGCVDDRMRMWLCLMRYAGLRCCEVAWICRDWIIEDGDPRIIVTGKRQKQRVVFVDRELIDMLRPWMARQGRLFLLNNGHPVSPKYVSDAVSAHFKALGLPHTAHNLRHSFGSRSLDEVEDIRVVQELMGHSSPATTALYTEVNHDKSVRVARAHGANLRKFRRRRE